MNPSVSIENSQQLTSADNSSVSIVLYIVQLSNQWAVLFYATADNCTSENADSKYKTRRNRVRRPCPSYGSVCYSHIVMYIMSVCYDLRFSFACMSNKYTSRLVTHKLILNLSVLCLVY